MSSTKNKMFCVCSQNICVRMLMSGKTVLRILRCKYGNLHVASGCRKLFTSIFISFSAMFDAELCAMHDELHTAGWVELYFLNFFLIFQKKIKENLQKRIRFYDTLKECIRWNVNKKIQDEWWEMDWREETVFEGSCAERRMNRKRKLDFFFFLVLLITVLGSQSALGGFLFLLTKSLLTSIGNGVCLTNQLSDVWLIAVVYSRSNYNSKALEVARQSIYFLWALPNSKLEAYLLETRIVIAADIQRCLTMLRLF